MNILPHQLNGKTIKDCYEVKQGVLVIEFTDGTKIELMGLKVFISSMSGGTEKYIDLELV